MEVFLVVQWRDGQELPEFQGVFSTKELAEAACKTHLYSVRPFTLDEALPDENMGECPLTYFPLAPTEGQDV